MRKQGTVGKRKHLTLMIPQKLKIIGIIRRLESGYGFLHQIINYLRYKETQGPITIIYGIK